MTTLVQRMETVTACLRENQLSVHTYVHNLLNEDWMADSLLDARWEIIEHQQYPECERFSCASWCYGEYILLHELEVC